MSKFIAVHSATFTKDQLAQLGQQQPPAGVSWNNTFCSFGDGKTFCEWEAPDKQTIEAIFQQFNVPYDSIHEVQRFNTEKGDFE